MTSAQAYAIRAELASKLKASGCSLDDLVKILRLHSKEDARKLIGRARSLPLALRLPTRRINLNLPTRTPPVDVDTYFR